MRSSCNASTSCSNGRSWLGLGAKRGFARLAEYGLQRQACVYAITRNTWVFTKKPTMFSISTPVPVGNRYAYTNILLPGIAVQQGLKARQQCHEEHRLALGLALQARYRAAGSRKQ